MNYNPFDHVNKDKIAKRVANWKKEHPDASNHQACSHFINETAKQLGVTGVLTGLPANLPIAGQLIALAGGALVDLSAFAYKLTELVLELGTVYDRDLDLEGTSREGVYVLITSVAGTGAGNVAQKVVIQNLSRRAVLRYVQKFVKLLGFKVAQKNIAVKWIPIIGSIVGGGVHYLTVKALGKIMEDYYETNPTFDSSWNQANDDDIIDIETDEEDPS